MLIWVALDVKCLRNYSKESHLRERLHELETGLFSALKMSDSLITGTKLELKKGTLSAHVNAP